MEVCSPSLRNKRIQPPSDQITIRDNGIGMDKTTIESLFNPFFSTKDKGAGLVWLSLARLLKTTEAQLKSTARRIKAPPLV